MTQTTIDLRAALAALATEPETAAPAPKRPTISQARRDLVLTMMQERYPAEVVEARYPAIDWDNMSVADFKSRLDRLRKIAKISGTRSTGAEAKAAQTTEVGRQDLVDGYYTVVFPATEDEPQTHLTLRLLTQEDDAEFMPGRMLVSLLTGPNNEADYLRVGHIAKGSVSIWTNYQNNAKLREAIMVLVGDPRAAQTAYAEVSRRCAKCSRKLTHPDSQVFGPECAKKMGA